MSLRKTKSKPRVLIQGDVGRLCEEVGKGGVSFNQLLSELVAVQKAETELLNARLTSATICREEIMLALTEAHDLIYKASTKI